MNDQHPSRRTALGGAAAAGAAALGLGACSPSDGRAAGPATPTAALPLGDSSEVPVGGARLYREDKVVVAQPTEGDFKAFSAVCTHGGCVLTGLEELTADCACHGSRFDAATGEVLQGPATVPLIEVEVRADGGRLVVGPQN
ncbi:Rieske (2Fe-2S) protein [Streptomyces sp. 549]|uniref:Rieske (2Fe-2S) protein n=1 Tax=Streptomyces sp. 549 TaxID=3049076 RepID=UPI0024C3E71B|nr:Rieske (2Fe-2S) protein [Streptomyces sp. 549]MDK1474182.1 Rieske (2Fe-2S) protein [Streptomyces sp. 549]